MLTKEQESDKVFITRPDRGGGYPNWPYLPMKRRINQKPDVASNQLEAGTIIDRNPLGKPVDPAHECFRTIYLISIWEASHTGKKFSEVEKKVYETVEAMLLDGWEID